MTAQHTPTPWNKKYQGNLIRDKNDSVLAEVIDTSNAAFIVRAVNSHDALVEALELAGECFGQHNLLSTATDEDRRAALKRFFTWWNEKARHVVAAAKQGE